METLQSEGVNGQKSFAAATLGRAASALDLREKAARAKVTVDHAVEDGVRAAKEAVRKGRFAAEDLVDHTTLRIRKYPLRSLGWAFGCGVCVGSAILLAFRIRRRA